MLCKRFQFAFLMSIVASTTDAQLPGNSWIVQSGFHTGFIFAHSTEVQNTAGARPINVELTAGRWRNDSSVWNLCRCAATQAVTLTYHDYDSEILGRAVSLSYSLEPYFLLNARNAISVRALAGLAYLTNPFDPVTNPGNQSYSMSVSAYLGLGVGYWYKVNDQWNVGTNILYQHISNGGINHPNKGINWPTGSLLVNYSFQPRTFRKYLSTKPTELTKDIRWDVSVFGVAKRVARGNGRGLRYLVIGGAVQAARQVGRINNLTVGTEVSWDDALGSQLRRDGYNKDPWRASVLIGHEFVLGKFLFSQRLGAYVYQAGNTFDPVFHRWGIAYRLNEQWMLGINLKAHRQVADYTDFRLAFSF